ncbi:MAG: hypothetical protein SOV56_05870 [Phascolarctobacterium sp.]|nr:hypothetical protein [Phascolarctobacterium sp.]
MTITIERFTLNDIAEATCLTQLTWGEEMALANTQLKEVLYEAMVRYYFRSSEFSYKIVDEDGTMQGFLLATPLTARDSSQKWLQEHVQGFAAVEQDLVYNYLRYLSYNGQQVRKLAQAEDLLLCLFLSRKPGVGSKLLENVEDVARAHSIKRMHLWADATCDYSYYRRRGYKEAGHFINKILPELGDQATWIYSKEVRP